MILQIVRFSSSHESTLGLMLLQTSLRREFLCYTLEDEYRSKKVYGQTRIPDGMYDIKLRTFGGFHDRYAASYGYQFHKGMLWLQDVPDFENVLIHKGNDDDDTAGCILLGDTQVQNKTKNGFVGESKDAYDRIYPEIAGHLEDGGSVKLFINSFEDLSYG